MIAKPEKICVDIKASLKQAGLFSDSGNTWRISPEPYLLSQEETTFFHELGHYFIARVNRIGVDVFSIGFGREIYGWYDKRGTRWRISLYPLGGYVKMLGEDLFSKSKISKKDSQLSLSEKKIYQRFISPFLGFSCRFTPTCSHYAIDSIDKFGIIKSLRQFNGIK